MKIGIIGFPQTGKKTLFEILTGQKISERDLASAKPILGIAEIRDGRFDKLVDIYDPKNSVRAKINIEVLPKIEKDSIKNGDIFKNIADTDAICHVVRRFTDDSVYHLYGSVDAERDIDEINAELILHDLVFVEKRMERIESNIKKTNDKDSLREKEVLLRMKDALDKEMPLRTLDMSEDEKKLISSYPFVTRKEMIIVVNASDDDLKDAAYIDGLIKKYSDRKIYIMQVSAKVESEISQLGSDEEKKEFLAMLGIEEAAIDILTRLCLKALDLISFFTVGKDEVRQWNLRRASSAPEGAGVIHSDLQRGFIRAEVIKYDDLVRYGSEEKVKTAGKLEIKGKDYIVEDGDILNIRFNV